MVKGGGGGRAEHGQRNRGCLSSRNRRLGGGGGEAQKKRARQRQKLGIGAHRQTSQANVLSDEVETGEGGWGGERDRQAGKQRRSGRHVT